MRVTAAAISTNPVSGHTAVTMSDVFCVRCHQPHGDLDDRKRCVHCRRVPRPKDIAGTEEATGGESVGLVARLVRAVFGGSGDGSGRPRYPA